MFYSELDDLDLEVLKSKGYTYDTYFPEADEMVAFIINAFMEQKNIICQCAAFRLIYLELWKWIMVI